jgi:ornithine cyclodeaminase/alanine dehydrogenase-like protein (mu-crystallin family)
MTDDNIATLGRARNRIQELNDEKQQHETIVQNLERTCDHKYPNGKSALQPTVHTFVGYRRPDDCRICHRSI